MCPKHLLFFDAASKFRDRFLWDGYTMSETTVGTTPQSRRFAVRQNTAGFIAPTEVTAENTNLDATDTWNNVDNPDLFEPANDPLFNWNGGTSGDYTYTITETLTGAATAADGFFSAGAHASSDFTGGGLSRLELSPVGTAGTWRIEIAVTHTPSGLVRTGILNFDYL